MADLPSGTVTFLFTDIEGSTALWEQHPDAQAVADLHRAHGLLRLRQIMEATGTLEVTGSRHPFVKGDSSTPSRLVWHSPSSPAAVALSKALSSAHPSLRRVRLPASR